MSEIPGGALPVRPGRWIDFFGWSWWVEPEDLRLACEHAVPEPTPMVNCDTRPGVHRLTGDCVNPEPASQHPSGMWISRSVPL